MIKRVPVEAYVTITSDEAIAEQQERQREASDLVYDVLRPAMESMDSACMTVLALGYRPDQCSIEVERSVDLRSDKRTLSVLGKPCFEVTIEALPMSAPDYKFEIITTPRVIEWPPQVVP